MAPVLSYYISLCHVWLSPRSCSFSNERQKWSRSGEKRGRKMRSRRRRNCIQDILYEKISYFQHKKKRLKIKSDKWHTWENNCVLNTFSTLLHRKVQILCCHWTCESTYTCRLNVWVPTHPHMLIHIHIKLKIRKTRLMLSWCNSAWWISTLKIKKEFLHLSQICIQIPVTPCIHHH